MTLHRSVVVLSKSTAVAASLSGETEAAAIGEVFLTARVLFFSNDIHTSHIFNTLTVGVVLFQSGGSAMPAEADAVGCDEVSLVIFARWAHQPPLPPHSSPNLPSPTQLLYVGE